MSYVETLARYLAESRHTVALTGAGVSTESGIPDFRGSRGLWRSQDAVDLLSLDTLYYHPDLFYSEGLELLQTMRAKEPNSAHRALAFLEQKSLVSTVITQNIDGLHQDAGSKNVLEIHGNLRTSSCVLCHKQFSLDFLARQVEQGTVPPKCSCGGVLRPDVVFFGDPMPQCFNYAIDEAQKADLMLVVGSSLQVAPVAHLPSLARELAIVNLEPTPYDHAASVVIHRKAGEVLVELTKRLENETVL